MAKFDVDKEIDRLHSIHGNGVQISMMDIPKLFKDCREAHARGEDLEQAVKDAVVRYKAA